MLTLTRRNFIRYASLFLTSSVLMEKTYLQSVFSDFDRGVKYGAGHFTGLTADFPPGIYVLRQGTTNPVITLPYQAGVLANPIIKILLDFAAAVGANVLGKQINNWISGVGNKDKKTVNDANSDMDQSGYTDRSMSHKCTHIQNNVFFYGFGAPSYHLPSGCASFIPKSKGIYALIESPVILGLASAASQWKNVGIPAADALIPTESIVTSDGQLDESFPVPYFLYKTKAGDVSVAYDYDRSVEGGHLRVVSTADEEVIFDEEYEVYPSTYG